MKFRATLVVEYEVLQSTLMGSYGTNDPAEAAKIDQDAMNDDPGVFLNVGDEKVDIKVEVIP